MRRIDIFVSSTADVQKERSLVERLIRSIAVEVDVPVTVSYSNRFRELRPSDKISERIANGYEDGGSLLCPCFWEYQDFQREQEYQERIPNTGQYDLVVCILWSRLGTKISPAFVMPDGSQPTSATEYEIAWALDQANRTPGFPELHVYRNRSTPVAPLEPKEERETSFRQWDSVQEFFLTWKSKNAFTEACSEYQDLREFENLFRRHFREFVTKQLDREIVPRKTAGKAHSRKLNPFRGLEFFNFEDAAVFHGRTKAIGEVLDALKKQANAERPFVLIIGPSGSGKSSLVRAGVLPFLTEVGSPNGPWRRAMARPGAGGSEEDPFRRLAVALLAEAALPELQDSEATSGEKNLAWGLRKNPESVARHITELLDQASEQELYRVAYEEKKEVEIPGRIEGVELARHRRLTRLKPEAHLALIVDPLEELFTGDFSPELQREYIAALVALIRSKRVYVIATLQSDFYTAYQQFPELIELAGSAGRYDLQPPTAEEIENMIRLPAEACGLRFEQDRSKDWGLEKTILDAAVASAQPLPLLEHLLSELYRKQAAREDGLLRWSDYVELGEFQGSLAHHAETLFATLKSDAQGTFDFVMRRLVFFGAGDQGVRRTVLYRDIVSPSELDSRQKEGTKIFVDSLIKEGLLYAEPELTEERIICISHQVLLRKWPRIRHWLTEDRAFLRMRDRLDASLNPWVRRGRLSEDLLGASFGVTDAETLLRHFRSSLSKTQIDYIEKILATQKHRRRIRESVWLAVGAGLVVLAAIAGTQWYNTETQKKGAEELERIERKIAEIARENRNGPEGVSKQLKNGAQTVQQNSEPSSERARPTLAESKEAQAAQESVDLSSAQRATAEAQLKQAQENAQAAPRSADLANAQRTALEAELKQAQDKAQTAQQHADRLTSEQNTMEADPKEAGLRAQLAEEQASLATSQRSATEEELKKTAGQQTGPDQEGQTNLPGAKDSAKAIPTPDKRPISNDQDQSKPGQNSQNQTAETQWNPTIGTSPEPSPTETLAGENTNAASDEQQLKSFVVDYLKTVAIDDVSTQERFFAHRVAYFDQGVISLRRLQEAKASYDREWPTRDWRPQREAEIHATNNPNLYEIIQPYTWTASDGTRQDQGSGTLYMRIYKTSKGELHIVHIERHD
jgi:hypothetical protein